MTIKRLVLISTLLVTTYITCNGQVIIIDSKWSDTTIDFKIALHFVGMPKKQNALNTSSLPQECETRKDVYFTIAKLGFGKTKPLNYTKRYNLLNEHYRVEFDDVLQFNKTKFLKKASFDFARFNKTVDFRFSTFLDSVSLRNTEFTSLFTISNTQVVSPIVFNGSQFQESANFENATFRDLVDFSFTPVAKSEILIFRRSNSQTFGELYYPAFQKTVFQKTASFKNSKFYKPVRYAEVSFNGDVNFDYAVFKDNLTFKNVNFTNNVSFYNTQLPDSLALDNIGFQNSKAVIDLRLTKLDSLNSRNKVAHEKCKLFLRKVDFDRILINSDNFELCFDINTKFSDVVYAYERVINKCRELGMKESEEYFAIELKKLKLRNKHPNIYGTLISLTLKYWWNFGYNREKIIMNTIYAFSVVFLCVFFFLPSFLKAYSPKYLELSMPYFSEYKLRNRKSLTRRVNLSFFYTLFLFFNLKISFTELKFSQYPFRSIVILVFNVIGLIHLAYLISLILNK